MKLLIAGLALALAGSAQAQVNTNCRQVGISWNCTSTDMSVPDTSQADSANFVAGMAALGQMRRERESQKRVEAMAAEVVIQAVEAGDCYRAKQIVIQFGDAEDLEKVDRACVPAGQPIVPSRNDYKPEVAKYVSKRRCLDARNIARLNRDPELAEQVRQTCAPKR